MNATYNITDNRLKFWPPPGRLDPEQDKARHAANFAWWPGRKCFAATWTPQGEDFIHSFGIEIEQDDTPDDLEGRVERFAGYAQEAEQSAEHAADYATRDDLTERRARLAQNRATNEAERAQYWTRRIAGAISRAAQHDRPDVIVRRIKGLEADERKHKKDLIEGKSYLLSSIVSDYKHAHGIELVRVEETREGNVIHSTYKWNRELTPEEVSEIKALFDQQNPEREAWHNRWLAHLAMRLEYERAYLDAVGGDPSKALDGIKVGDKVMYRGRVMIAAKINKTTITLANPEHVPGTFGHYPHGAKIPKEDLKPYQEPQAPKIPQYDHFFQIPKEEVDPDSGFAATAYNGESCNAWTVKIDGTWWDVYVRPGPAEEIIKIEKA